MYFYYITFSVFLWVGLCTVFIYELEMCVVVYEKVQFLVSPKSFCVPVLLRSSSETVLALVCSLFGLHINQSVVVAQDGARLSNPKVYKGCYVITFTVTEI